MTTMHGAAPRRLRLWPGVLAAALIVLFRFVLPVFLPDLQSVGVIAGIAGLALVLLWWVAFSRAPGRERIAAVALIVLGVAVTRPFLHPSIATGMMGMMFVIYALPAVLGPAFVGWAAVTPGLSPRFRWATMAATILLSCGVWLLVRSDGITGDGGAQLAWRWTPTPEERLMSMAKEEPAVAAPAPAAAPPAGSAAAAPADTPAPEATPAAVERSSGTDALPAAAAAAPDTISAQMAAWPGFRGRSRDGVVTGIRIATDWAQSPPVELWRRPVGPAWSSFAVGGDLFYTQEQRGEEEIVAAYRLSTGEPVWRHRDAVRFWESNAGAGPRATPALSHGRVYAFGATGILNALDARTGARAWSRDVAADNDKSVPTWGFASSPLVIGNTVIVAAAGRLAAYDAATGTPRWFGADGGGGYSSPHLSTFGGVRQIVFQSAAGAAGVDASNGAPLWQHAWAGTPIVQPHLTPDGDLLIASGDMMGGMGMRRLAIRRSGDGWGAEERWTSNGLKPYFNDFVVHRGQAFGFDGRILSCIDLADGSRKWKGGRYGQGQLVLLADQDLLLVLSEEGELALVSATGEQYRELARFKAIEGKTWNHPALAGDVLLVRNGEEMAAFRLARSH